MQNAKTAFQQSFQVPGVEETLALNPPEYWSNGNTSALLEYIHSKDNLVFADSDASVRSMLKEWSHAEKYCKEYIWHVLTEFAAQPVALIFAERSKYTKAFSVLVAERLETYVQSSARNTRLPKKCEEHFQPKNVAEIGYGAATIQSFSGIFLALLVAHIGSRLALCAELLYHMNRPVERPKENNTDTVTLGIHLRWSEATQRKIDVLRQMHKMRRLQIVELKYA